MRIWMLGSGSRGNAMLIEAGDARVIVDAGFSPPVLAARLRTIDIAPESVHAVIVTHEHTDHVRGVKAMSDRYGWTAYATAGTIGAWPELADAGAIPVRANEPFTIGDIEIRAMRSSHDAAEPVVLVATETRTGTRAGIAYDLGIVTHAVAAALTDLDLLVLEANHDELMLQNGPYPPSVRARIAGRTGHLSNRNAAEFACSVAHGGLRQIVLAHLSEKCNTPAHALGTVRGALARTRFKGRVAAAPQDGVVGPFEPGSRRTRAVQLALAL